MQSKTLALILLTLMGCGAEGPDSVGETVPLAAACPVPPGNVLPNGSFDGALTGWRYVDGVTWSSGMDADNCPGSGSANIPVARASMVATACLPITAGARYTLSARAIAPATAVYRAVCELAVFTGANCDVPLASDAYQEFFVNSVDAASWQTLQTTITIPARMKTAYVSCGPGGAEGLGNFFFDQIYLVKN